MELAVEDVLVKAFLVAEVEARGGGAAHDGRRRRPAQPLPLLLSSAPPLVVVPPRRAAVPIVSCYVTGSENRYYI